MAAPAGNTFLTIGMITRRALMILENNLTFVKYINRTYDSQFAVSGAKIGATLNLRIPPRYTVNTAVAFSQQGSVETQVPLVLNNQHHVDLNFTSADLTLNIDDFSDRFIQPAIAALANEIDRRGLLMYQQVYNVVGTPGTPPASTAGAPVAANTALFQYGQAYVLLDNEATPRDNLRSTVINPTAQNFLIASLSGLFQSSTDIAEQYRTGNMGLSGGSKYSMDQNGAVHTIGPLGGSPQAAGGHTDGDTVVHTQGWTAAAASRLVVGDVFTIANVYAVNPQTRLSTGLLRNFVVTAAFSSTAGGGGDVSVSPPLISATAPNTQGQTITALPAASAPITVFGAANTQTPQNLAFHRDAFACASVDLEMPGGVDMAARVASKKLGFSMRLVRQYDINYDAFPCRVDVLYGFVAQRPQLACRIAG